MSYQIFKYEKEFPLESGKSLPELKIAYHTYGSFDPAKSNVIWVCHALTANSDVFDWWPGLFGDNNLFNPKDHFIVCANVVGSCYGTTGAHSDHPHRNKPYYQYFPQVTVRDMIRAHQLLAKNLGVKKINTILGGSLGGQQVLEWAIAEPERFENVIPIATNAQHSPWGIAFNESQRLAIQADRTFYSETPEGGQKGLKAARSIALLSYRNYQTYRQTQSEKSNEKLDNFKANSYQQYQGDKLINRFNAHAYWTLSKAMDSHNVGRGRESIAAALRQIKAKTLVIGISSDILFPPAEQKLIAKNITDSKYVEIDSLYGHDGFLIETGKLTEIIQKFYQKQTKNEYAYAKEY